jgi:thiol:disulfide interchange protein DsbA
MLRRVLLALLLSSTLAACNTQETPPAETPAAAQAPAAAPAAPVETPVTPDPETATPAPAPTEAAPTPAPAAATPPAAKPVATAPAPVLPPGEAPRLGIDYEILEAPQPTWGRGKIEVAEVFGYTCIHCAHLQPELNEWHKRMPSDVRFEYVPAAFGGAWDAFAKAFYSAEALGVRERTHDAVFDAIHVKHAITGISDEEVADLYASLGVDRAKFLAQMTSFGTNAKLAKARQFATRTGISATPTVVVNGKYRVSSTRDRGFPGMLSTIDYLVALERAGQAPPGAP